MCKVGIEIEIKDQKLERHAPITKIMLASKLRKKTNKINTTFGWSTIYIYISFITILNIQNVDNNSSW
jgi:hypothetical protein